MWSRFSLIRLALAGLAVLLAYGAAVTAALLTGSGIGGVNLAVESFSSASSNALSLVTTALPVGYAFGAGMVAAVNPCGFALLPAYLGLYIGQGVASSTRQGLRRRWLQAVGISAAVTLSFVILFGVTGLLFSLASLAVAGYLPWAGLAIGVALVLVGGQMLRGGGIYTTLGERVADRLGRTASRPDVRGYLAYGLAYGIASLSCTLPIFLAVVGTALSSSGFLVATSEFLLYALGMGTVLSVLTLSTVSLSQAGIARVRAVAKFIQPVSAVLVLMAGAYVIYYWLTLGGLLRSIGI